MCRELVQSYERWLKDILLILDVLCEDVVPAGKPEESVYWRTRKLYEDAEILAQGGKDAELETLLKQYCQDGLLFLQQFEQDWSWRKLKASIRNEKEVEETRIQLRRKYAKDIVNSLQMLVNLAFLLEVYFGDTSVDVRKMFELSDKTDKYEVKKVRPGVVVNTRYRKASAGNLKFA